jgi:carboxylesterase
MSPAQCQLTAESLRNLVDEVMDIAHGLGHHVTAAGLSAGGVLAGWVAQYRPDVDQAVLISPVFGLKVVRPTLTGLLTRLLLTLPNHYRWWDPNLKARASIPRHAYPRFSSRGLAHILRLGLAVQAAARHREPAVRSIQVITNPHDWAVNNELTARLVDDWRRHNSATVQTYAFDPALQLNHDLIDPEHATPQVEVVYPVLLDLITKAGRKEGRS